MTGAHAAGLLPVLAMWLVMTFVMMAPVVFPWLRAVARVADPGTPAALPFGLGYALAWAGFSLAAAVLQTRLVAPDPLLEGSPALAGSSLLLAGAFQFTALKDACLSHCRSPFGWLLAHWRPGPVGVFSVGLRHGLFCLGCCWALMALALVVGMMNLTAMALLMAVMVMETVAPFGRRVVRPAGAALVLAGLWVLLA